MDAVDYKIEVLPKSKDMKELDSKKGPEGGGVWIEGLMIEGADTNKDAMLIEATGKSLIYPLPIVHVTAQSTGGAKKSDEKKENEYDCPVYKYPRRTD